MCKVRILIIENVGFSQSSGILYVYADIHVHVYTDCVCVCVCVCSQGRYGEAINQWEVAKGEGLASPSLYSSVMQLAARVGGVEAARHVKADMDRQGWSMEHQLVEPVYWDITSHRKFL